MKIFREWANPVNIDDVWNEKLSVIPSKSILGYFGGKIQTDSLGNRIDASFDTPINHFFGCCIGGSTTFGHFCTLETSYPKHLQSVTGIPISNLGLAKADLWLGFQNLMDYLRLSKVMPNFVIFLDGVNQNSALTQSINAANQFQIMSPLTQQTRKILEWYKSANDKPFNIENFQRFLFGKKYQNRIIANSYKKMKIPTKFQFIENEASIYVKSISFIKTTLDLLNIKSFFCLQPTLYDVWQPGNSYQKDYLTQLYSEILKISDLPIDTRKFAKQYLRPEHFIDWAHLDSEGNKALAKMIAEQVLNFDIFPLHHKL